MTTSILNTGDSTSVDVAEILAAPKGDFAQIAGGEAVTDDKHETTYRKVTGNEEFPMSVRVGHYRNPGANDGIGQTNMSVKVQSFVQELDSDSNVVYTLPGHVVIATSMPGRSGVPDEDDLVELVGNALSWLIPIISGAVSQDALDELKFGVTTRMTDHVCSGSV